MLFLCFFIVVFVFFHCCFCFVVFVVLKLSLFGSFNIISCVVVSWCLFGVSFLDFIHHVTVCKLESDLNFALASRRYLSTTCCD